MGMTHYLPDAAGFARAVLIGILAGRLDSRFSPRLGAMRRHACVRLHRDRPDFIWIPPVFRDDFGGAIGIIPGKSGRPFMADAPAPG